MSLALDFTGSLACLAVSFIENRILMRLLSSSLQHDMELLRSRFDFGSTELARPNCPCHLGNTILVPPFRPYRYGKANLVIPNWLDQL